MSAIDTLFESLRSQNRKAFMPFVTAGDPDLDFTSAVLREVVARGSSMCELGIPYSDPIADGPVIQASYTRALDGGVHVADIFDMLRTTTPEFSISATTFSREMNVATGLAQDMLEKLSTLTYTDTTTDPALTAGAHPGAADVNRDLDVDTLPPFLAVALGNANIIDERGLTLGPTLYTRPWSVTDNTPATDMKSIAVTVSWTERGAVSTTRSVTITGVKVQS